MRVAAILGIHHQSFAEVCLIFSPQIAVSAKGIFIEIGHSGHLFSEEEFFSRIKKIFSLYKIQAKVAIAEDIPTALAMARYGNKDRNDLPIEALSDFIFPFSADLFPTEIFRKLGVCIIGDFLKIPRRELASRFGKSSLLAFERILQAKDLAWPRFTPEEKINERVDFDYAAQIKNLEPVHFLLKQTLDRVLLRLIARGKKLQALDVCFHLDRFSHLPLRERHWTFALPVPQISSSAILPGIMERIERELAQSPLTDALEGLSVFVTETTPLIDSQKDFFQKQDEEKEAWGSLLARLQARLGERQVFHAAPLARLLPERTWSKDEKQNLVHTPERPLRLFSPIPLRRIGNRLQSHEKTWKVMSFAGPEKICGEWWLDPFAREYYRVQTENEELWIFQSENKVFLQGIFD